MISARSETTSSKARAPERWLGAALGLLVVYLIFSTRGAREEGRKEVFRGKPTSPRQATDPTRARISKPAPSQIAPREAPLAAPGGVERDASIGAAISARSKVCPSEMVLVKGSSCPRVEHTCKRWLDDATLPYARCAEYETSARCIGEQVSLQFCIDAREYTPIGESLPQNYASFVEASRVCGQLGKRMCLESEWNFACEGPDFWPYPYGFSRNENCNQDLKDLYELNPRKQVLKDHRVPSGSLANCRSPFGVYDMVGNLDEPVLVETQRHAYPRRSALKGGWWMAGRNRCRPATTAHDDHYRDIQIGIRCCRDAPL